MKILILTALSREYRPLKKLFPSWRLVRKRPSKKFAFKLPGKEIILIECGMGAKSAKEALGVELAESTPDLLIFSGFAGGLQTDLPTGVVCFVASVRGIFTQEILQFRVPDALSDFLAQNHIRPVLTLSVKTPGDKQTLSALAFGETAVVDMETATVAEIAWHNKIPFICLRAISDPVGHDLGFDFRDIADERGKIRLTGVLFTIIRKPATLKSFYLLWRGSRRAARNLCEAVAAFLGIPAPLLGKIADGIEIERQREGIPVR
jgi:adenosylhomocysteine nucleosidase